MMSRAHEQVEHLLGREVEYACIPMSNNNGSNDNYGVCADCKKPAKYLVVEKKDEDDHLDLDRTIKLEECYFRAWYYCGVCEVG